MFLPLALSALLPFDYGIYGIMAICCFYFMRKNRTLGVIFFLLLNLLFLYISSIQFLSLLALPLILLHNDGRFAIRRIDEKTGYSLWRKYFFYIYYPIHLTVLYFLRVGF
jgi:hypothetical protein